MKGRGVKLIAIVALVWWWMLLIRTPPSEGLWKDYRYDWIDGRPRFREVVYRLYPEPSAWLYEWVLEPLGWPTQDW